MKLLPHSCFVADETEAAGMEAAEEVRQHLLSRIRSCDPGADCLGKRLQSAVSGLVNSTAVAIVTTDASGRVTSWNAAAEQMFGHPFENIHGQDISIIVPERFRTGDARELARIGADIVPSLAGKTVEVVALRGDGSEFPVELSLSSWTGPYGREFGAQILDISARHARDMRLRHMAIHDPLTGLPNRREFLDRLSEILESQRAAAVFMVDLDGFKGINDTLGHSAGDDLLRLVALRIAARLPAEALFARLGGDEFAVLLPDCSDLNRAGGLGEVLLEAFDGDFSVGGHELHLSASVGFALAPAHADQAEELLVRADLALFEAKRRRGSSVRAFNRRFENKLQIKRDFKDEIRKATVEHQWRLHFQPQVNMADDTIIGAEALLRWKHPAKGLLSPRAFLDTLEKHAVAADVGRWTLNAACAELVRARRQGHRVASVSVNLFAVQLRNAGIEKTVLELLGKHGLVPEDLELELTETVVLQQNAATLDELRSLRRRGVRLAFDDFGTGFASFSTLKNFTVDKLKIDKSFVAGVTDSSQCHAIIGGIVHVARTLDMQVVAEGIETVSQRDALIGLGCTTGQGFLWGKPAAQILHPPSQPAAACAA